MPIESKTVWNCTRTREGIDGSPGGSPQPVEFTIGGVYPDDDDSESGTFDGWGDYDGANFQIQAGRWTNYGTASKSIHFQISYDNGREEGGTTAEKFSGQLSADGGKLSGVITLDNPEQYSNSSFDLRDWKVTVRSRSSGHWRAD